ncbi:MAG TPA: two-component system sensor histidine kinase PhoR, partial [Pantoea sp.]|nr:two-component system sensor histidine kinase PhoR [Pantoea sp.]
LAIVKHALSHHNARLEITSIPDKETCFTFTLPSRLIVSAGLQENAVH